MATNVTHQHHFHPELSRVNESTMATWLTAQVSGDLQEVPGIGPATATMLQENGIENTYQLFAKFLSLKSKG